MAFYNTPVNNEKDYDMTTENKFYLNLQAPKALGAKNMKVAAKALAFVMQQMMEQTEHLQEEFRIGIADHLIKTIFANHQPHLSEKQQFGLLTLAKKFHYGS